MERTYSCPMSPRGWKAKGGGCTWVATSKIKYKQIDKARKLTYTIVQLSCVYIFITSINIYIFFSKNITPPSLEKPRDNTRQNYMHNNCRTKQIACYFSLYANVHSNDIETLQINCKISCRCLVKNPLTQAKKVVTMPRTASDNSNIWSKYTLRCWIQVHKYWKAFRILVLMTFGCTKYWRL